MNRILLITLWLLIPLGLAAYHYGPGQSLLKLDHAEDSLALAREASDREEWEVTIEHYKAAMSLLPAEEVETAVRIQIEIAKAMIQSGGLPEAREDLAELVEQLNKDSEADSTLKQDAISTLANSRYYMTYLMKLEGLPPAQWEPEIDAARQEYKLLAQSDSANQERHLNDLEAVIRLARAEPTDLYGLPIPQP
ncbi:MAG: hypothetical protein AAF357_06295 [Verrucomicrobiota bacterium]